MPSLVRCHCTSYKCQGGFIAPATKRSHDRADTRLKTTISQTVHRGLVIPHIPSKPPVLKTPYPTREALLPPVFEFADPQATSSCAAEQEMLDHGTLTQEDMDIQIFGNALPNLGPNFHSPEALHAAVDHFELYNTLSMEREIEKVAEEIDRQKRQLDSEDYSPDILAEGFPDELEYEEIDVDALQDDELLLDADDSDLVGSAEEQLGESIEDDPDPFEPDSNLLDLKNRHLSTLPPYQITIYATYSLLQMPKDSLPCEAAEIMLKASSEDRGTVAGFAALSKELDEENPDAGQLCGFSPRRQYKSMSTDTYQLLAKTLCFYYPLTPVHCRFHQPVVPQSHIVQPIITVLYGQRTVTKARFIQAG
ncbi:hypothetical protein HYDPIDRAFT_103637 [Hydnomerulius pinastri MD-312]|uniref:Unplaced genomic scaffold scaffold_224, whole genome shotgun sequence n=1 Tax=Hydnomerulius pinastri MD-312 TaxID=994086 RepID=A0A0C9UXY2_9AGAM|nr:hypothetical protein HYDPIDRAFT_103637 [Hydnomerulius pinastri MD-312]